MNKILYIFLFLILVSSDEWTTNIQFQKQGLRIGQCKNISTVCRKPKIQTDYNYNGVIRSGYLSVVSKSGSALGFIFYGKEGAKQQQLKNYPIIISLSGGPGLSSQFSNLKQIGPFVLKKDFWVRIQNNTYAWTKQANLVFIDQPLGTGFTCLNKQSDIPMTTAQVAKDLYQALYQLFDPQGDGCFGSKQLKIPPSTPLYIFGQGYGGKFASAVAAKIMEEKRNRGMITGLKGVGIGDGFNAPIKILEELGNYAFSMSLLDYQERIRIEKILLQASFQYHEKKWGTVTALFEKAINYMNERSGINAYDITKDGAVIEGISIIDDFFSNDTNIDHYGFEKDNNYETMSQLVYTKFANDFMKEEVASVEYLLNEGISVLVYQGQDDGYINTAGTIKWVEELNYANAEQFRNARFEGWRIDDRMLMLGSKKSAGNLTLVIVNNAGHFVPQDNPESALYMLRNFLYNTK